MSKFSILHISDIHKIDGVEYEPLFQSLRRDMDSYTEHEGILPPTFVVVSGDLIQGAYTEEEIIAQYTEVESFLSAICELYLQGDRSRLIVVPGNHDVSRVATTESLQPSTKSYEISKETFLKGATDIRWNWKDHQFYEITDADRYGQRFNLFVDFYNRFFNGVRKYPEDPEEQGYVVLNDDYGICFACFNSCCHLDHLCDTGCISDDALNSISKELTDSYNAGYLNVAVWHHHFYGSPLETNYMDRVFLTDLLSCNIQMGLFGHQHFTQIAEEYSDLLLQKDNHVQKLLLVSSGTLFGGKKVLPDNCRRQYNVIEIDKRNGEALIDISIREDFNTKANNKIPHWKLKPLPNATNKVHYNVELRKMSVNDLVLNVDRRCKADGDYLRSCEAIKKIEQETGEDFTRLFKSYLKEVKDYEYVYHHVGEVKSVEDAILKIVAARNLGKPEYIKEVLADSYITKLDDPFVNEQLKTLK